MNAFGKEYSACIITAYENDSGLILGQIKVDSKENEIVAIPKLLKSLDIKNSTVFIDAVGCQKKIAEQIIDMGGDYVLAVKGNQKRLMEDIEDTEMLERADAEYREVDGDHGRIETRTYKLYHNLSYIEGIQEWKGLGGVVSVESVRVDKKSGNVPKCKRYFIISDRQATVESIARAIRGHWAIENQVHWPLDVVLKEDRSRKRAKNSAENYARVLRLALVLLIRYRKRNKLTKKSFKGIMLEAMTDTGITDEILIGHHIAA